MIRLFHRWPGLIALALVTLLAVSGAALSVLPAAESLSSPQAAAGMSVAELAGRIVSRHPDLEQIKRSPSGRITASWTSDGDTVSAAIDPATGEGIATAAPNGVERWLVTFHRSLFLADGGRLVMAAGALAMLALSLTGMIMTARRLGGWRRWFAPVKGPFASRLHTEIARLAVAGLMLSAVTALWMTASTFGLVPDQPAALALPETVSGRTGIDVSAIKLLQDTPVADFRELTFPYAGDTTDVFTLKTGSGSGMVDQGTGALLVWHDASAWERISGIIAMLHTGRGAAVLGLLLGLLALGVPALGLTGLAMWFSSRRQRIRIRNNAAAGRAETVILVASEGGSTWNFAASLHAALTGAGHSVHSAALSGFVPSRYAKARRIIIMAATYGDGGAPASAQGFIAQLAAMGRTPDAALAVLGFGDSSFPAFCAFARSIAATAAARGWPSLLPLTTVDRQSPRDFADWGRALGEALGVRLDLRAETLPPPSLPLTLLSRRDYGAEVQAPQAILRFALPEASLWRRLTGGGFQPFEAGDLLGILPEGSAIPRFYSLASGKADGFIEIAVRKHAGGLCSGQLMALEPGQTVSAFIRSNPAFHAPEDDAPLILIGAGTGIGPLAGFIRANERRRPIHLFFGFRHEDSDCLFDAELTAWREQGRLGSLVTASSRGSHPHYVQEALRRNAGDVLHLIRGGARIMVCGGRGMARGVKDTIAEIAEPLGLTPDMLRQEGRYAEDCY